MTGPAGPPTWWHWRDAPRVCLSARGLRSTLAVALVVGTVLFAINQLDVVLAGRATARVWFKTALTYLVPFVVANYGLLVGSRRPEQTPDGGVLQEARRKHSGHSD